MSISERVNEFLTKNNSSSFCDDCIAEILNLSRRQQANRVTGALGTTDNFLRKKGMCSGCDKEKIVIRKS